MLRVESVVKSFGGFKAVDGANLQVNAGEIVAVIGRNGAGKTTTMKSVGGMLRPKKGTILFEGEDVTGRKPYQLVLKSSLRLIDRAYIIFAAKCAASIGDLAPGFEEGSPGRSTSSIA